nr:G protein-coupled receptor [Proales similis]
MNETFSNEPNTQRMLNSSSWKNTSQGCSATLGSKIFLSMCPMLLLFGTCTNIFSLLVLSRKRMRKHSTYVYLAILSVIDLLALWLGLLRDYLAHGYGIYIGSTLLCRLHSFFFYYTLDMSSWILVAVSLDRFLAITFRFSSHTRQMLLKLMGRPKLICSFLAASLFFLNSHLLLYIEVDNSHAEKQNDEFYGEILFAIYTKLQQMSTTKFMNQSKTLAPSKFDEDLWKLVEQIGSSLALESKTLLMMPFEFSHLNYSRSFTSQNSIGVAGEYYNCVINQQKHPYYLKFFVNVWPYIDLSTYAIVPFLMMSFCNIAIIKNAKFSTPASMRFPRNLSVDQSKESKFNKRKSLKFAKRLKPKSRHAQHLALNRNEVQGEMVSSAPSYSNDGCSTENINQKSTRFSILKRMCPFSIKNEIQDPNQHECTRRTSDYYLRPRFLNSFQRGRSEHLEMTKKQVSQTVINSNRRSCPNIFNQIEPQNDTRGKPLKRMTFVYNHSNQSFLNNSLQSRNLKMMTVTIISITCIFIALTLPIMLFIVAEKIGSSSKDERTDGASNEISFINFARSFAGMDPNCKSIIWSLVNTLMYINHSINFVLYCLTGSKFRTELATLFMPKNVSGNMANTNELTHISIPFRKFSSHPHSSFFPKITENNIKTSNMNRSHSLYSPSKNRV